MTAKGPILVINPNSDVAVTEALSRAVEPFRLGGGPAIECVTIAESPLGIMTQRDVYEAALRTADLAKARPDASAIVIACYSQPGLDLLRTETRRPVVGMQDAACWRPWALPIASASSRWRKAPFRATLPISPAWAS